MVVLSFTLVSLLAAIGTLAAPPNYPGPRHPEPHRPGRDQTFDPNTYVKQFAQCQAVDRSGAQPQNITLKLAYIDINPTAKKTLVMVHGWPSLWTTYRNQIAAFGSEYRLILPENRGFGSSEHPKDLYSSNAMFDFVNDLQCIMDHASVSSGVCVGNDFGAQVCWEAGLLNPSRFIGVFNVGIPFISSALPFIPNAAFPQLSPKLGYTIYLSTNATGAAAELNVDPRSAIRSCAQKANAVIPATFLQDQTSFLTPWKEYEIANHLTEIPFSGIMSPQVEDYMVASYQIQGFFNTFNGYQVNNRNETYQNEKAHNAIGLAQPTFALFPTLDPVANWHDVALELKSYLFLRNYYNATINSAHWPHEELPDEFNLHFTQWIGNVTFAS